MSDLSRQDPTGRFTGLADIYARCRPSYPDQAVDFLLTHCGLAPGALVVDVGCGTGIFTRLLAGRGLRLIGIEPNVEMRRQAESETGPADGPPPEYRDGRAEATDLPEASADAVVAAQAFHWFNAPVALAEFSRILSPGGWLALLWNERDEVDPFTAAYGNVVRHDANAVRLESARGAAGTPLLTCPLFTGAQRVVFTHFQDLDLAGMLGRAFSASYAPRSPSAVAAFGAALEDVFRRFQDNGRVRLWYETAVYVARRPPAV